MAFYFNHEISQPLYKQLYEYLKLEIQFGRLNAGEKLPSIRALALDLKVS
ncbi:GntR family transcriptional regulator, partial [Butyricicoccus sp. 1XD8-22]